MSIFRARLVHYDQEMAEVIGTGFICGSILVFLAGVF